MRSMQQEQVNAKRSSLSVGKLLMVKEGMAGKVRMLYARPSQFCCISVNLVRNIPAGYVK